jgi:hypothetical protein
VVSRLDLCFPGAVFLFQDAYLTERFGGADVGRNLSFVACGKNGLVRHSERARKLS